MNTILTALFRSIVGAVAVFAVSVFILCLVGVIHVEGYFVRESAVVEALETIGFSNVVIVKRSCSFIGMRGGGEGDDVRFEAEATNPSGKRVRVYVFAGWPFKGATVRSP